MLRPRSNTFFRPNPTLELTIGPLSGELNTYSPDIDIANDQLSDGQNMTRARASDSSLKKRGGIQLFGPFLGASTGILAGYNSLARDGTQDILVAYNTALSTITSSLATTLSGVTLTANLPGDFAYYPITNKTYYVNGTDNVVKFTPGGSSGDQTDASFKKGTIVVHYKNRLLVSGVSGQEDYIWYTDLGVDTFSSANYFRVNGKVTSIIAMQDKVLIFTKRRIFRLMNFIFSGIATGPESVDELPVTFGAIAHRTVKAVNNFIYFLGQDNTNKASVYFSDGYQIKSLSDTHISSTLNSLNPSQLPNACGVADGFNYRIEVAASGKTLNTIGILYDTVRGFFYPIENRILESRAEFSVLWSSEVSGVWQVFGGTAGTGQVYELNANDGLYDEIGEERYLVNGSYNVPIDANPARRAAQSFKMTNYSIAQSVNITQVAIQLKKNAGTTTQLTIRLETDNNGTPSGTLVNSNATTTIPAITATSYAWYNAIFPSPVALIGATKYWLVAKHTTEGSGSSQYYWLGDSCTATYAAGNLATYTTGITATTLTYNPDATPESTSVDGVVVSNATADTWSNIYNATGTATTSAGHTQSAVAVSMLASATTNLWRWIQRGVLLFDTSSLPDDAVITSAKISLYTTSIVDQFGGQTLGVTSASPASNTTLAGSDFTAIGATRLATDLVVTFLNLNAYNDFTLNASGLAAINVTGDSKFAMRFGADIDNAPPAWVSGQITDLQYQTAENVNKPRLVVTYTSVTGSAGWNPDLISDQTFVVYAESAIDGYIDSKAFLIAEGREAQVERFFTIFNTAAKYSVEVSFASATFAGVTPFSVNLTATPGATWGDGVSRWGDNSSIWGGGQTRNYQWTELGYFVSRVVKMRIRNRLANQQFEFNRAVLEIAPRLSQT